MVWTGGRGRLKSRFAARRGKARSRGARRTKFGGPSPARGLVAMVRRRFGAFDAVSPCPRPASSWRGRLPVAFGLRPSRRARAAAGPLGAKDGAGGAARGADRPLGRRNAESRREASHAVREAEAALHPRSAPLKRRRCTTSRIATAFCMPRKSTSARSPTEVGTPFYCYSTATLERHYRGLRRRLRRHGRPRLLCHEGELEPGRARDPRAARRRHGHRLGGRVAPGARGRRAGRADRLLRSRQDPARRWPTALDRGILCFNVEFEPELAALSEVAVAKGRQAPVSIRVNPDVDAKTHRKISTGRSENKFGIPIAQRAARSTPEAAGSPGIAVTGVDMHIGSQITDLEPYDNAAALLAELARDLMADGHACGTSTSAAASAFPIATTTSRRRIRRPMRRSSSGTRATSA